MFLQNRGLSISPKKKPFPFNTTNHKTIIFRPLHKFSLHRCNALSSSTNDYISNKVLWLIYQINTYVLIGATYKHFLHIVKRLFSVVTRLTVVQRAYVMIKAKRMRETLRSSIHADDDAVTQWNICSIVVCQPFSIIIKESKESFIDSV